MSSAEGNTSKKIFQNSRRYRRPWWWRGGRRRRRRYWTQLLHLMLIAASSFIHEVPNSQPLHNTLPYSHAHSPFYLLSCPSPQSSFTMAEIPCDDPASSPPRLLSLKNWRNLSDDDFQLLVRACAKPSLVSNVTLRAPPPCNPPPHLPLTCALRSHLASDPLPPPPNHTPPPDLTSSGLAIHPSPLHY